MNIGFLATFPNPNDQNVPKAGYRHVTELIKLLSENNKITLYSVSKHKWTIDLSFCNDIIYIRSSSLIIKWLKIIRRIVKDRKNLDLLIVYNPSIFTFPVIPLKMLYSIPIIVDYVDKQGVTMGVGETRNKLYNLTELNIKIIELIIERLFLLTINSWITSPKYLEKEIRRFKKDANILFYRGTLSEQCCLDENAQSFPVIVNEDNVNIAYMGGLFPIHGVDVLLNAFSKLTFGNIHLYITGYGPMKQILENTVDERKISDVSLIHLDEGVVHKFMSKMDILVLPYKNAKRNITNFPSKIIEYMGTGKAIIATTVGEDVLDIFENGKTAILIEPENEEALRKALANLITDDKKRKELGINARRYFEDNFSEKVVKSKITEYLNNIVNNKNAKLQL